MESPAPRNLFSSPQLIDSEAPPLTPTRPGLDRIFHSTLSPTLLVLSTTFAVLTAVYSLFWRHVQVPALSLSALATCLLFLWLRVLVARKRIAADRSHGVGALIVLLTTANALLLITLTRDLDYSAVIYLLVVSAGFFFLATGWLTLTIVGIASGWALVVWRLASPVADYQSHSIAMLFALIFATIVHTARTRTLERLERYRLQSEHRKKELELALERAEVANAVTLASKRKLVAAIRAKEDSQLRFKALTEATFEGILIHDRGKIQDVNSALIKMSGFQRDDLIGTSLLALFAPESRERIERLMLVDAEHVQEAHFLRKDGSIFPVEINSRAMPYSGQTMRAMAIRDVGPWFAAQQALQQSEALYRQMFEKNQAVKLLIDPESGAIVEANSAAAKFYHYTLDELKAKNIGDINTLPMDIIYRELQSAKADQRHYSFKHRLATGAVRDVEVHTGPVDVGGRRLLYSIINDVTERVKAERRLRLIVEATSGLFGQAFFRALVKNLAACMEVRHGFIAQRCDDDPHHVRFIAHWDGKDYHENIRHPISGTPCEQVLANKTLFFNSELRRHFPNDAPLKAMKIESYLAIPLTDSAGQVLGCLGVMDEAPMREASPSESILKIFASRAAIEIARSRAEELLRQSEAKYRRFFLEDLSGDFISTPDGTLLSCNPAFARLFGFASEDEALQCNVFDLYPSRDKRIELMERLQREGKLESIEVEFRHVVTGKPLYVIENVIGGFDEHGKLVEMRGYLYDITERKALESQLLDSQKMEAVGRLAGGVAHDFNNLLTAITGYSELILSNLSDNRLIRSEVEEIRKACEIGASLTGQLLAFSRRQVVQPERLNINGVIGEMEKLLYRLVGENIELEFDLTGEPLYIIADPGQLKQVIINLAVNSLDAMPNSGRLEIRTAALEVNELLAQHPEPIRPGSYALLQVTDTGHGMDNTVQAHIFEPFFTTKSAGKGTGLGLSTVYGVVKQSNGYINVQSEPEKGTDIAIYFPLLSPPGPDAIKRPQRQPLQHGSGTILLAEDEDAVRTVIRLILSRYGYTVLAAGNAKEALRLSKKHDGTIDLLVSDMVMPGTSGRELAAELKKKRPAMKALFISGYVDDDFIDAPALDPGDGFLQKPFSPEMLLEKVQEMLAGRKSAVERA